MIACMIIFYLLVGGKNKLLLSALYQHIITIKVQLLTLVFVPAVFSKVMLFNLKSTMPEGGAVFIDGVAAPSYKMTPVMSWFCPQKDWDILGLAMSSLSQINYLLLNVEDVVVDTDKQKSRCYTKMTATFLFRRYYCTFIMIMNFSHFSV